MPTFSSGYIEPGTYVSIEDAVIPSIPPGALAAAFTGTGNANKTIVSEKLTLTQLTVSDQFVGTLENIPVVALAEEPLALIAGVIDTTYIQDAYGRKRYSTEVVTGADVAQFTINLSTGVLTWNVASGTVTLPQLSQEDIDPANDPTVTYPRTRTIYVTYEVAKTAADFQPIGFDSLESVINTYGQADENGDGVIENTLPLAAQIYFENGGSYLYCVQVVDDTMAAHEASIDMLKNFDTYCVVPLIETSAATNAGLINYIKTHVDEMSTTVEKLERLGLLSGLSSTEAITNPTDTAVATHLAAIQACNNYRVTYLVPAEGKKTLTTSPLQITLPGCYIQAAVAAIICKSTTTSGEPISGKQLAGFDSITDRYTRYQKNKMASYGGFVIENVSGVPVIRHALSSKVGDVVTSELKITRIKDVLARTFRSSFNALFINKRDTGPDFLAEISTAGRMLLDGSISTRDIVSWQNFSVKQNSIDPRQIDVLFQIKPTWDANYILVTFGVAV